MGATLVQLNISAGGMPKKPINSARVTRDGVAGDWQKNRKYHGGPNRAVCLYSEELYAWLREQGIDVSNGDVGENFTTRGLDLQSLSKGNRLRVGDQCIIQITDVRVPCNQLRKWGATLPTLIVGRSGWVARVVAEGEVKVGDRIRRVRAPARSVHPVVRELLHAANGSGHGPLLRAADSATDAQKVNDAASLLVSWLADRARRRAVEYVDARDPLDLRRCPAQDAIMERFLRHCPGVGRIFERTGRVVDFRPDVSQKDRWAIEDYALEHLKAGVGA